MVTTVNTEYILGTTIYGQASGNYDGSSQEFFSDAQPGVSYYQGQGSIQTITIRVTGFVGIITMQATLMDPADTALWFDISSFGDGTTIENGVHPVSILGNYVWVRAKVTGFDAGTIDSIQITY